MYGEALSRSVAGLAPPEMQARYRAYEGDGPELADEATVALSVIITLAESEPLLRRGLARLVPQIEGRPIEVIVPYDRTTNWVAALQKEFPSVQFADLGAVRTTCRPGTDAAAHELADRRKAFGLNLARGEILALLDGSVAPDADWCDRVVEAHHLTHGIIGGCVEYAGQSVLEWAVYLQDFGRYQRPLPEGPALYLTNMNISYKRHALFAVHEVWRERYSEAVVQAALVRKGVTLWQRPHIIVRQHRGPRSFRGTLVERYRWGRRSGSVRTGKLPLSGRLFYLASCPVLPLVRIAQVAKKLLGTGQRGGFLVALPCLLFFTTAWCAGEFMGHLTGCESSA
jgi:hypothetical protein